MVWRSKPFVCVCAHVRERCSPRPFQMSQKGRLLRRRPVMWSPHIVCVCVCVCVVIKIISTIKPFKHIISSVCEDNKVCVCFVCHFSLLNSPFSYCFNNCCPQCCAAHTQRLENNICSPQKYLNGFFDFPLSLLSVLQLGLDLYSPTSLLKVRKYEHQCGMMSGFQVSLY